MKASKMRLYKQSKYHLFVEMRVIYDYIKGKQRNGLNHAGICMSPNAVRVLKDKGYTLKKDAEPVYENYYTITW